MVSKQAEVHLLIMRHSSITTLAHFNPVIPSLWTGKTPHKYERVKIITYTIIIKQSSCKIWRWREVLEGFHIRLRGLFDLVREGRSRGLRFNPILICALVDNLLLPLSGTDLHPPPKTWPWEVIFSLQVWLTVVIYNFCGNNLVFHWL